MWSLMLTDLPIPSSWLMASPQLTGEHMINLIRFAVS
jgi:hypothetical protein